MVKNRHGVFVVVFSTLVIPVLALGQEDPSPAEVLVGRLPPGLLGFLAISGSDDLKADFDKSSFGKAWHESSVQTFYTQVKDQIWAKVFRQIDESKDKARLKAALSLLRRVVRSPMAVGVGASPSAEGPKIHGFLVVQAGPRRAEMADNVSTLERLAGPGKIGEVAIDGVTLHTVKEKHKVNEPPILWGWVKDYFVVVVNDEKAAIVRHLSRDAAPAAPGYHAAIARVPGTGDTKILFLDIEKISQAALAHTQAQSTQPARNSCREFLKELGLDHVKSFVARAGFTGPDMVGNTMLTIDHADQTIFSDFRPVDLAILDLVPANAMEVKVSNMNFADLYDRIMAAIKTAKPEKHGELEKKIAEFEARAGVKVRQGILENLAGPAVGCTLPSTGMVNPLLGNKVHLLKLNDAKTFKESFLALERFITERSEGKVQATVQEVNDQEYHVWVIPQLALLQVAPCWTIRDRTLVIAPTIAGCQAAVNHAATQNAAATSIRTAEPFKQITKDLPEKMISFRYVDHKAKAAQNLQTLQQFWPMIALAAQQKADVQMPMLLPPAEDITRHMGPEVGYAWFTEEGIRSHHQGAVVSSDTSLGVPAAVAGASIATPALGRSREMARRSMSAANLRQIGLALNSYATLHDDKLPASLQELVDAKLITPKVLVSPLKPEGFTGPSYILVPVPNITAKPDLILAYENPAYQTEGTHVLRIDASVAWEKPAKFMDDLKATYTQLGKPMPAIQFGTAKKTSFLQRFFDSEEPATTQDDEFEEE